MTMSRTGSMRWMLSMALAMCVRGALAGDAAPSESTANASTQDGLMSFPNVVLEHAPQIAAKPAGTPSTAAGMRVYIDPKTGQRRERTLEDAQREAKVGLDAPNAGRTGARAAAPVEEKISYGPGNTVSIALGEDTMMYQVAQVQADGKAAMQCVTGKDAAAKALQQPAHGDSHVAEVHDER